MTPEEHMLDMLDYFWREKGDITRWSDFDREKVKAAFPEIIKAWDDYQTAERVFAAVMRGTEVKG
jgi:hypothetical protein